MLSVETLSLAKAYTDKIKEQLSVGFTPKIVDSLPAAGQNNILYLVLKENGQEGNIYNEYIWIDNKYEFIGNTDTSFIVDNALSATSENPVQNKVIKGELDKKIEEPSGNGVVRKYMSGVYTTAGVDTTMPTSPTDNNIPTTKLLKDYVEDNTSNPLQLSDNDKTKPMTLIQHNYDSDTQTEKYIARSIDVNTLSESGLAAYNIPTSKAVISWVKAYIESLNQSGGA